MRIDRFFRDGHGRVVVAQWPNPALIAWLILSLATRVWDAHAEVLRSAAAGALIAWAADEVLRGVSPFRRVLGAVVLVLEAFALARR